MTKTLRGCLLMRSHGPRRTLTFEFLEERSLLSGNPIEVTTGASDGIGSLRDAIDQANQREGHDTIFIMDETYDFNHMITPTSALPEIRDGVTICTESGFTDPEQTVYINCTHYLGAGLVADIYQGYNEHVKSPLLELTNIGVANAEGHAFKIRGSDLTHAHLTKCWVHGRCFITRGAQPESLFLST